MKLMLLSSLLAGASLAQAEVHALTLKQVAERAMTQSPDVLLARLDEQRAAMWRRRAILTHPSSPWEAGSASHSAFR
jgi:hypothetical protein